VSGTLLGVLDFFPAETSARSRSSLWRHAVYYGLHHHAADAGPLACGQEDPGRRRGRTAETQSVHALSHRHTLFGADVFVATWLSRNGIIDTTWWATMMIVVTLTTGTVFVMWLGEQITERGVGNGISLLDLCRYRDRAAECGDADRRKVRSGDPMARSA
jgi:hypothetical protein